MSELGIVAKSIEDELKYLRWFRQEADFGPATGDVIDLMNDSYEKKFGPVPQGWSNKEEEEQEAEDDRDTKEV